MKRSFSKEESGQSAVTVLIAMTVLLGFASLAVDLGNIHLTQIRMQAAADNAALAAACDLPDEAAAGETAEYYGKLNGGDQTDVCVSTPYDVDQYVVKVECSREVTFLFAEILGYHGSSVSADAVARKNQYVSGEEDDDDENDSDQAGSGLISVLIE